MRRMLLAAQSAASGARAHSAALLRDQCGVSAVEFALIAPILVGGLLLMVDIGLAVSERMGLDHVLRAGAHAAMAEQDKERILTVLEVTASEHFTIAGSSTQTTSENPVVLSVDCVCSGESTSAAECTACAGSAQAHVYYRLSAEKIYNGVIFKGIRLRTGIEVQLR